MKILARTLLALLSKIEQLNLNFLNLWNIIGFASIVLFIQVLKYKAIQLKAGEQALLHSHGYLVYNKKYVFRNMMKLKVSETFIETNFSNQHTEKHNKLQLPKTVS